jgi:hypothetical protein
MGARDHRQQDGLGRSEGKVGGRAPSAAGAAGPGGGGAAGRKGSPAGREMRERRGSRRQKRRDDGGARGAAGSLYPGQAARGRVARSGRAKPEEATHRHRFYPTNRSPSGFRKISSIITTISIINLAPSQFAPSAHQRWVYSIHGSHGRLLIQLQVCRKAAYLTVFYSC